MNHRVIKQVYPSTRSHRIKQTRVKLRNFPEAFVRSDKRNVTLKACRRHDCIRKLHSAMMEIPILESRYGIIHGFRLKTYRSAFVSAMKSIPLTAHFLLNLKRVAINVQHTKKLRKASFFYRPILCFMLMHDIP